MAAVKSEKNWGGRTVLVTGINGFVGANLAKGLLDAGAEVVGVVRDQNPHSSMCELGIDKRVETVDGSLTDYPLIERAINEYSADTVFHLAAQAIVGVANRSPLSTFESNIKGTWNLLEACRLSKTVKSVVMASSDKAYGDHKKLPYVEDFKLNGLYPYDASKACADILGRCYNKSFGLPVAVTRFCNIYGPADMNFSRIIPDTIRSIVNGKNPIIRSDGTPVRDYIYVDDAVRGYMALGEMMGQPGVAGEAFNFGTESHVDVLTLVNEMIAISGKKGLTAEILSKGKISCEIDQQYLDWGKSNRVLGWEPKVALKDGLKKTYEWYAAYLGKK
jgi:CDP-glucose 4,6-dehydratase